MTSNSACVTISTVIIETIILAILSTLAWVFISPIVGAFMFGALILKTLFMVLDLRRATLATIDKWPPFGRKEKFSLSIHRNRHGDFYGYLGEYFAWELTWWEPEGHGAKKIWKWVWKDEPPRTKEEAREMNWYLGDEEY